MIGILVSSGLTVRSDHTMMCGMTHYPFVITVSSEKGGVGKTTLATNLAIFLKALREELPVTVFSFDNHFTVDKMFAIAGQQPRGTVAELLAGTTGSELLHTGQYGVDYIPSSMALSELRGTIQGPMFLARLLATSGIPGIVIIDTRPELDILTQNALYAADQVFIPVKDMASLENCRNIFALFDSRGLEKKSLSLLPCLIDSRIKFDGMFRDQKSLLKAFAIHRGYRCLDSFISKSPKVDSLNTNPDGRIYPILTHARGTEVYLQFAQLARQVLSTIDQAAETRARQFSMWLDSENERRESAFARRKSALNPHCPLCGRSSMASENKSAGYYYETTEGSARGFLHSDCFFELLAALLFSGGNLAASDPFSQFLAETTGSATFLFRPLQSRPASLVELLVVEATGRQLLRKQIACDDFAGSILNRREGRLHQLLTATLGKRAMEECTTFLLVQPVDRMAPEAILVEEQYRQFRKVRQQLIGQLAALESPTEPARQQAQM